ncbi:Sulfate transport system permease protein CysT [Candidatus Paraburkholderia schumanniana]|nr:Sulfate transport system permease protein CysT [Candidatus Paraburkholderia schumannianae]
MTTLTFRKPSALPGFGLTLGITLAYLSLVVLIPLAATFAKTAPLDWSQFVRAVTSPRVLASYRLTFGVALGGALINAVFGFLVAWVLVRYTFPFKHIVDAIVDLPFALPTSVAGISLAAVYAGNDWIGQYLAPLGIKVAFTPLGVLVALTFIGLPFVVRTVQPVLEDFEREQEEAAACLGATRWLTFRRVVLPSLFPALLTGFALAFARALGEYGLVIFIAGNVPMKSEITSLLIITKLEQYDYAGATALAVVMLCVSFLMLLFINTLQWFLQRRAGVVRPVARRARRADHFRGAGHRARDDLRHVPLRRARADSADACARQRRGGSGACARRIGLADLSSRDAAEREVGPALRRNSLQRARWVSSARCRWCRATFAARPTRCRCTSKFSTTNTTSRPHSRWRRCWRS